MFCCWKKKSPEPGWVEEQCEIWSSFLYSPNKSDFSFKSWVFLLFCGSSTSSWEGDGFIKYKLRLKARKREAFGLKERIHLSSWLRSAEKSRTWSQKGRQKNTNSFCEVNGRYYDEESRNMCDCRRLPQLLHQQAPPPLWESKQTDGLWLWCSCSSFSSSPSLTLHAWP